MSGRIVKATIFSLIIVGVLSYVFYLNQQSVTVTYKPDKTLSGPLGLILICVFCFGAVVSTIWWLLVGALYQLRERRLARRTRTVEQHYKEIARARELMASGRYDDARAAFIRIIDRDPDDIVARIELAKCFKLEGNLPHALRILEEARAGQRRNVELLFLAAEINRYLGNHTGAFDNFHLVTVGDPKNVKALEGLVEESAELGRFEGALEYQRQLARLATAAEQPERQERLAELELLVVHDRFPQPGPERRAALDEILRRHRDYPPAMMALAELEFEAGQFDAATKLLARTYRITNDLFCVERVAAIWLGAEQPQRALSAVRTMIATKDLPSSAQLEGQMFHVGLLLFLEHIDEARKECDRLRGLPLEDPRLRTALQLFDALLTNKAGDPKEAFEKVLAIVSAQNRLPGDLRLNDRENLATRTNGSLEWKENPASRV